VKAVSRGSRAPYPASGGAITISVPNAMKGLSGRAAAAVIAKRSSDNDFGHHIPEAANQGGPFAFLLIR